MSARPFTPNEPSVLVAAAQPAGRFPYPAGQRLRHIIAVAIKQREHLMRKRIGPVVHTGSLFTWLERNPYPSEATVRAFPLFGALYCTMPQHAAGLAMLQEVRAMMAKR